VPFDETNQLLIVAFRAPTERRSRIATLPLATGQAGLVRPPAPKSRYYF